MIYFGISITTYNLRMFVSCYVRRAGILVTFLLYWSGWQSHPIKDLSPYLNTTQIELASLDKVVC